jgi:hypothetical protein
MRGNRSDVDVKIVVSCLHDVPPSFDWGEVMSRAFVREDVQVPEIEILEFQAFVGSSDAATHQAETLPELLRWARDRARGFVQVRDRSGVLLAEVG